MVYYAFDLLHLDGFDTRAAPLIERKRVLQGFLAEAAVSGIIFSEQFDDGADLYKRARRMGLEGIVSKRADAPYRSGRTEAWIKVKCWNRGRFVVVGFVPDGAGGLAKLRLHAERVAHSYMWAASEQDGTTRPLARFGQHSPRTRGLRRPSVSRSGSGTRHGLSRTSMPK
jgi:bifunctional non-homologous end joining protein LigD